MKALLIDCPAYKQCCTISIPQTIGLWPSVAKEPFLQALDKQHHKVTQASLLLYRSVLQQPHIVEYD